MRDGPPEKKGAPPGGNDAPLRNVELGGCDFPRDKLPHSKKQPAAESLVPIGVIAADVVADLRFRRQVERLYRLGPRVIAELLAEIGAERGIQTIIDSKVDRYAELDPAALEAIGGGEFWSAPVREVRP